MTGSLQVKNDKYYMAINTYVDGKRKIKWMSTGIPAKKGNKRKAEQYLNQTLAGLEQGAITFIEPNKDKLLFTEVAERYLQHAEKNVDVVTSFSYRRLTETQIIPFFQNANVKMVDVDRRLLQRFFDEKQHSGNTHTGGGLSPKTIQHLRSLIFSICKYAVLEDLISVNPCQNIDTPKVDNSCANYYNEEQLNKLFEATKGTYLYPIIKMTVIYGLRRSEVLGLKWNAFDFCNNTFTIQHVRTVTDEVVAKDKTKNRSSHRTFPMTPEVLELLEDIKKEQETNRQLFGKSYIESGYVFTKVDGEAHHPNSITLAFGFMLKEKNLPHIRFHDLRHSCASYLVNNGFTLKDVQEWMGHSSITTTANIYSHLDITRKQGMAEKMTEAFSRK